MSWATFLGAKGLSVYIGRISKYWKDFQILEIQYLESLPVWLLISVQSLFSAGTILWEIAWCQIGRAPKYWNEDGRMIWGMDIWYLGALPIFGSFSNLT